MQRYVKNLSRYECLNGWRKNSIGQELEEWADIYGKKIAIETEEEQISYIDLKLKADEMAYGLMDIGIKNGDNVVLQLPNTINFVISFFALIKMGAVPILALPAHRSIELEGIIEASQAVAYIVQEKYLGFSYIDMAEKLREKQDCLKYLLIDHTSTDNKVDRIKGEKRNLPQIDSYEKAFLSLSGGTTGIPKLIPRTHSDYMYDARMSAKRCKLTSDSVYLAILPIAHNFILGHPGLLGTLAVGGKVVLCRTPGPDEAFPLIKSKNVTITSLVPSMAKIFIEMMEWDDEIDISSLKVLQVGGAFFEEALAEKIINQGKDILQQVFGTAEGLNTMTDLEDPDYIRKNCQGKPISPADEMKIVDEKGNQVARGEYGELLARGPYTIDSYYNLENEESFTQDGFYRTGDKAMITLEGNLRVGGRITEQINKSGEKIMPSEIEGYLCQNKAVKDAAVVGVKDELLGQNICAFVVLKEEITTEELYAFLSSKEIAKFKIPDQIKIIESLPLTSVGKIDKKYLIKLANNRM